MSVLGVRQVESSNVSLLWGKALLKVVRSSQSTSSPLILSLAGFKGEVPEEIAAIRSAVDHALSTLEKYPVRVTGMTIFPWELWNRRDRPSHQEFCRLCVEDLAPRMRARDRRNQYGIYFERMMASTGVRGNELRTVNQVGFVINLLRQNHMPRRSALQIACFDAAKDHTGQRMRGFPCLQQVSISYDSHDQLAINAYYPTQYLFDRGYGNYLGLCHLGAFIAHETQMRFVRLNCFVGWPQLGGVRKGDVSTLVSEIDEAVSEFEPAETETKA